MKVPSQDGVWCFGQKFGKVEPQDKSSERLGISR